MDLQPQNKAKKTATSILLLTIASAMIAFNLKAFITNGDLFPGGFSGVTVLIQRCFEKYLGIRLAYSVIYMPLNAATFIIGFKFIGKKFTLYSAYVILLSSLLTDLCPVIPITYDVLLIAIFGALVNGAAITLCLHAGGCAGGTDFVSIYLSDKKGIDAWNYILIFNFIILVIAGVLFGFDKALYSIIYQFTQTQVLNTLNKKYQKDTLWIISDKPDEVYAVIHKLTNHGATLIKGTGFYKGNEQSMVYSVVGSDQSTKICAAVREADPKAFINIQKTQLVDGNFYSRPHE